MSHKLSKEDQTRNEAVREARVIKENMNHLIRKLLRGAGTLDYPLEKIRLDLCRMNIDESRQPLDRLFTLICDLQDAQDDLLETDSK